MKFNFLLIWFLVWIPESTCNNNDYLGMINSYLNASTVAERSKYMSADFHSFFITKQGAGENKSEALKSFQNWDGPLHPDIKIIHYSFHDNVWQVTFNEQ